MRMGVYYVQGTYEHVLFFIGFHRFILFFIPAHIHTEILFSHFAVHLEHLSMFVPRSAPFLQLVTEDGEEYSITGSWGSSPRPAIYIGSLNFSLCASISSSLR